MRASDPPRGAMDLLVGRSLGPYELTERLGGGGMASVYRGVHRLLDQARAVKVMAPGLATQASFVQLFHREARLAADLRHPNVVHIYDVGEQDGIHYIVMELLEGRSLRDLVTSEQPLSLRRAVHLLRQLADALDYAHGRGVAHRDVKPSNAFVGADDRLTLVDFGIARAADGTRLTITHGIGTPEYMAPEVFNEQLADMGSDPHAFGVGADLYALGVAAYELLTGQVPFSARTPQAIAFAQVHKPPPSPRSLRADVPEAVERVVLRQLAKNPSMRYRSAGEFAGELALAARPATLLEEAQAALQRDDLEEAARLADAALVEGAPDGAAREIREEVMRRRRQQETRTRVTRLLEVGDWRGAATEIERLREAGAPDVGELSALVEALRSAEEARVEAERRVAEERAKLRREREEWERIATQRAEREAAERAERERLAREEQEREWHDRRERAGLQTADPTEERASGRAESGPTIWLLMRRSTDRRPSG